MLHTFRIRAIIQPKCETTNAPFGALVTRWDTYRDRVLDHTFVVLLTSVSISQAAALSIMAQLFGYLVSAAF